MIGREGSSPSLPIFAQDETIGQLNGALVSLPYRAGNFIPILALS